MVAARVFLDLHRIDCADARHDYGEERQICVGKVDDRPIIDYSDAPELSDAWFEQASRGGRLHLKKQVSMRIDDDILDFFKSEGNRCQTRMHAVLRAYVDVHKGK